MQRILILLLALLSGLAATDAVGEPRTPERKVGIQFTGNGSIEVSFRFRDVFRPRVRDKLKSGLPTTVFLRLAVLDSDTSRVVGSHVRTCQIVYDLWDERFRVDVQEPAGTTHHRAASEQEAVDLCGILDHVRIPLVARPTRLRLAVLAEANPLSPEIIRNIKKWLSRPSGVSAGASQSDNFFGSFLSIFVNQQLGAAEAVVRFRSQDVVGEP